MASSKLVGAIGRGLISGAVGTVAMTLSEQLEMAVTGRDASQVPGKVGAHLLPGKHPAAPSDVERLNGPVHTVPLDPDEVRARRHAHRGIGASPIVGLRHV